MQEEKEAQSRGCTTTRNFKFCLKASQIGKQNCEALAKSLLVGSSFWRICVCLGAGEWTWKELSFSSFFCRSEFWASILLRNRVWELAIYWNTLLQSERRQVIFHVHRLEHLLSHIKKGAQHWNIDNNIAWETFETQRSVEHRGKHLLLWPCVSRTAIKPLEWWESTSRSSKEKLAILESGRRPIKEKDVVHLCSIGVQWWSCTELWKDGCLKSINSIIIL